MTKLVRRSHYDLFLQFRSNHLQYRIRPGNFWNDIVSLVHFSTLPQPKSNNILLSERVFPIYYELFIGNLRKSSWRNEDVLCPASHGRILQLCGQWRICELFACHLLKESFRLSSSNLDTRESGSRWNVGEPMATRNLTEIYINLRTEISRFKAYSLGDSGVRSDSPGVLWKHAPYTVLFSVMTRDDTRRTTVFDRYFVWLNRTMIQLLLLEERVI